MNIKENFIVFAGQDKNTCITKIFSKNSHGCIIVCDITNKESIQE